MRNTLIIAMTLLLSNLCLGYSGGNGEPNNPYQIANVEDLLELGNDEPNYNKSFILTADINLAGLDFNNAIIARYPGNTFTGIFDGDCHTIRNMTIYNDIYSPDGIIIGLFGSVNTGEIKNLNLENVSITIKNSNADIGGLIGYNYIGTVNNCHSIGNISGECGDDYIHILIGGLIGTNEYSTITNCSSEGTVCIFSQTYAITTLPSAGGLVSSNKDSIITDSYSNCNVISDGNLIGIGGFVASNWGEVNSIISNCYSSGIVQVSNTNYYWNELHAGGFAGVNTYNIMKCFSTTPVIINGLKAYRTGGFVGGNSGNISDCYSTGDITISVSFNDIGYLGGFSGDNYGNINNCYSVGSVNNHSGTGYIGGLVGNVESGSVINSSYFLETSGPDNGNGTPLSDSEMKHQASFVGWDFVGESINGTEDTWCIFEDFTYPKLAWYWCEPNSPNDICPGGGNGKSPNYDDKGIVNFIDFAIFAAAWLTENPLVSLDKDIDVDIYDLKIFCDFWLEEI